MTLVHYFFGSTSFYRLGQRFLTKISLVFWSIWRQQKGISKLTDLQWLELTEYAKAICNRELWLKFLFFLPIFQFFMLITLENWQNFNQFKFVYGSWNVLYARLCACKLVFSLFHLLYSSTSTIECLEISRMQILEISRFRIL